ncbi:MAG: hypothetical protein JKX78_15260 [Alteromonadaceae bacterium]|nr:hypothetical protein [Alteromonadaceae bacterium]
MSKKKDKNARKKAVKKKQLSQQQKATNKALSQSEPSALALLNYQITYDPLDDGQPADLPAQLIARKEVIYHHLSDTPAEFIDELKELIEQYPQDKALGNYLANAYKLNGDKQAYIDFTKKAYKNDPDYLFNCFQLALIYMEENNYKGVEEIFAGKFDLKLLFPARDVFHITEVSSMLTIAAHYYQWQNNRVKFLQCFDQLRELDPMSAAVLKLMPTVLKYRFSIS